MDIFQKIQKMGCAPEVPGTVDVMLVAVPGVAVLPLDPLATDCVGVLVVEGPLVMTGVDTDTIVWVEPAVKSKLNRMSIFKKVTKRNEQREFSNFKPIPSREYKKDKIFAYMIHGAH